MSLKIETIFLEFPLLCVANETNVFDIEFSLVLLVSEVSEGVNNDTTNNIEHNLRNDDEKGEVEEECGKEVVVGIHYTHIISKCAYSITLS